MKIIAVGDIHHGPNIDQIEAAIEREKPDLTVLMGDYFDQFDDHPCDTYRTAKWLKESLAKPNRVHLWGNHDLPYSMPMHFSCPGYTPQKAAVIHAVLDDSDWARFKLWHREGKWFFSHAGLSMEYAPVNITVFSEYLEAEEKAAWRLLPSYSPHWIWSVGRARGGVALVGGLLWCDWNREFTPIPGINQVVGHTPGRTLRVTRGDETENWCIDLSSPIGVTHILAIDNDSVRAVEV
jgi:hypothetical protein